MARIEFGHTSWGRRRLRTPAHIDSENRLPRGKRYAHNGSSVSITTDEHNVSAKVQHTSGHVLMGDQDRKISLLRRLLQNAEAAARYNGYSGQGRDRYDVRGWVAHESIFNTHNEVYRRPSTQQRYAPFSTWTRGLARVLNGFVETARVTADFFIENTPTDGVPYWDTGAPGLTKMHSHFDRPADPFNEYEPVDTSTAAICAQGYLRLGRYPADNGELDAGARYTQTGLTVAHTLLDEPYLSTDAEHEGLLLHSTYHQPNGWDSVPSGRLIACGESCMWGDYHLMELPAYLQRLASEGPYLTFFFVGY